MDDEWVRREVRIPKGTHLSKSKDSAGAERDLLREDGTNRLLGPTESRSVEEDDLHRAYPYESVPSPDSGEPELPLLAGLAEAAITGFVNGLVESIDWEAVFEHHVSPCRKANQGQGHEPRPINLQTDQDRSRRVHSGGIGQVLHASGY